jgi:hypothetical protein
MAVITRFAPGELADDTVAGAASVADALSRGYPAGLTSIGLTNVKEFSSLINLAAVATGPSQRAATSAAVGDTIKLFKIPANHVVVAARLEVVTAGAGAGTFALTDGTNSLVAATAVNAVGQTFGLTPRSYAADTAVSLLVAGATVNTGIYRVVVMALDMTGQETTQLITG